jgi:hypothetical protein
MACSCPDDDLSGIDAPSQSSRTSDSTSNQTPTECFSAVLVLRRSSAASATLAGC